MTIEAMKQAIRALEDYESATRGVMIPQAQCRGDDAVTALRKAIEEAEKLLKTTPEMNNSNYFKQEIVRDADMSYTIALQRAIEWHCESKAVPPDIAELCPYHSEMLNQALPQLEQKAVLK